jgi:hypothetical protein
VEAVPPTWPFSQQVLVAAVRAEALQPLGDSMRLDHIEDQFPEKPDREALVGELIRLNDHGFIRVDTYPTGTKGREIIGVWVLPKGRREVGQDGEPRTAALVDPE